MITEAKIENVEKIAEAVRTNNNSFHKCMRNKRSMGETVFSVCGEVSGTGCWEASTALPWCARWDITGNTPKTERSVLEAESEKLMKQRMRVEQVKKENEENRAT